MVTLFLKEGDIATLSSISGNTDADRLNQHIAAAQSSQLKRVLGVELFDKMLEDYKSDSLVDEYLVIYDDYLVPILVYFSAINFLSFDAVFDETPEERLSRRISNYRGLAVNTEGNFKEYLKTISIPEVTEQDKLKDSTNIIPWY